MIFQAYRTLDDVNTSAGIHTIFQYSAETVPILVPLILFAAFIISCVGSFYAQTRFSGKGNLPASFAVGGLFISALSIFLSFIPGMINLPTIATCGAIAIAGVLWLFFNSTN